MYPYPDPVDPFDVAYEKFFLELPTKWKRYNFQTMSDAEQKAFASLVQYRVAELRMKCKAQVPGFPQKLFTIVVVSGDWMNRVTGGQSLETEIKAAARDMEGWDKATRIMVQTHKIALRITVMGERARQAYYAGNPNALGSFGPVPGYVYFEKIKIKGQSDSEINANNGPQAVATASVGDIIVNVHSTTIAPESSAKSSSKGKTAPEDHKPLFTVTHWSELTIGIDEHWRYWAKTPSVKTGENFKKQDAHEIQLPGDRWKTLLKLLAESESGNCCETASLIRELGHLSPPSSLPRDTRARPGSIDSNIKSELPQQKSTPLKQLKDALKDLARKLRECVKGPKGRNQKAALRVVGEKAQSGFNVGFLIPDQDNHLFFRKRPL